MSEEASGPGPPQPAVRRLLLWLEPELEPVTHRAGALTVGPRTVRRAPLSRGRPPGSEGRGAGRAGACGSEPGRSPPGAVPPPAVPPARRRGPCPSATAAGPDTSPRGAVSRLCTARRLRRRVSSPSGHLVAERFADGHSIPGKRGLHEGRQGRLKFGVSQTLEGGAGSQVRGTRRGRARHVVHGERKSPGPLDTIRI